MYDLQTEKSLFIYVLFFCRKLIYSFPKLLVNVRKVCLTLASGKILNTVLLLLRYSSMSVKVSTEILGAKEESLLSTLREKCPNTEFFLVCIFQHSD